MAFSVLVLLLVLVTLGVIVYYYLPRPLALMIARVVALVVLGWVLLVLFYQLARESPRLGVSEATFLIFLFVVLLALFVWGVNQLLRSASTGGGPAACPPTARLKDLLADRLPPPENGRLAAHLESCKVCQKRVEDLAERDRSWPGLADKLSDRPPDPEPALRRVMDRLKEKPEAEATSDEPRFAGDLPLGFLGPADKPGQLGRLERYEVLEEIGRGGMGVVLKAFDPSLHRVVAIKVLAPQLATSGVARKRFLREARAAAAVAHDHIVTIFAVDEANGLPYLVMQYVAGRSLQERIDKEGPLEPAEVVRIGMQTAAGLAAAHAHGIVHRDIKPANILLEERVPRVRITDFGLARAVDDASLTQSGFVAGSPLYMAPEQARGEALDHRADLFSLGSVLYTLSTGRPPFRAANTLAVLRRVSEDTPRPIRETNPEVPEGLAAVVEKLMAKEPAERYQSAADVADALGQLLAQLRHADWVPPPRSPAPAASAGLPTSVTLCPSCGASLHVPERMVGSVVHCAECGKPFQVEEGSSIQVARAVPPPFGPRPRPRRKVPVWVWVVLGCVGAVLLVWVWLRSTYVARQEAAAWHAAKTATTKTPPAAPAPRAEFFWKDALTWFPAEATVFGAYRFPPSEPLTLHDARTQPILRLCVPEEVAGRLTPENLGRIQLSGLWAAYYEGSKTEEPRAIVHLEGVVLDGRKRVVDFIRRSTAEKARIEDKRMGSDPEPAVRVSVPDWPFALGLRDDYRAFLARSLKPGAGAAQHLRVLEQLSEFDFGRTFPHAGNLVVGYNPPWIKGALDSIPPDACGFLIGEIPAEWRKRLSETLELRACPRTVVMHLTREGQAVNVALTLGVDRAGDERLLKEDLEKWRQQGLDVLKDRFPAVRTDPGSLALLNQTLANLRWDVGRGSVQIQVRIGDRAWRALGEVLLRVVQ